MQRGTLFCLFTVVAAATAASIFGGASLTPNGAGVQGGFEFPSIPGINSPLFGFSFFPPRGPNGSSSSSSGNQGISFPQIPDINSIIPQIPDGLDRNITLPQLPAIPSIPGLQPAIQLARNHVSVALNITNNFIDGIQSAINEALSGDDPTTAVRTLVNTIVGTYLDVALNCPMIIIGARVLQEGIRLAGEVGRSIQNVIRN